MATITTDFTRSTVSRTRADRSSAGVVAGYIRELAGSRGRAQVAARPLVASARATARETVSAAVDAVGASAPIGAARGRAKDGLMLHAQGRGRGGCSMRGKRALGAC